MKRISSGPWVVYIGELYRTWHVQYNKQWHIPHPLVQLAVAHLLVYLACLSCLQARGTRNPRVTLARLCAGELSSNVHLPARPCLLPAIISNPPSEPSPETARRWQALHACGHLHVSDLQGGAGFLPSVLAASSGLAVAARKCVQLTSSEVGTVMCDRTCAAMLCQPLWVGASVQ
jgi:hypothetical protein